MTISRSELNSMIDRLQFQPISNIDFHFIIIGTSSPTWVGNKSDRQLQFATIEWFVRINSSAFACMQLEIASRCHSQLEIHDNNNNYLVIYLLTKLLFDLLFLLCTERERAGEEDLYCPKECLLIIGRALLICNCLPPLLLFLCPVVKTTAHIRTSTINDNRVKFQVQPADSETKKWSGGAVKYVKQHADRGCWLDLAAFHSM